MATKFMSGTELFMYECMMQQTPNMARCEREEKRFKAQYIGLLRDFMREYGYGEISKRVTRTIDRFLFDEVMEDPIAQQAARNIEICFGECTANG